jgi:tetratricopeptide (TPR) repeat protein
MRVFIIMLLIANVIGCGIATRPVPLQDQVTVINKAGQKNPSNDRVEFELGYAAYEKKKFARARDHFYRYLDTHTPDDTDYEWAQFFVGISLARTGFSHAAVDLLSDLVTRKPNPKIVSYSLEFLEEVTRTLPFDRDKIIFQVLSDQTYGFVDQHLNDFVNFHQGVFDWEHGFFDWGNIHFKDITPGTYYFYRYRYQLALFQVYKNDPEAAIEILLDILVEPLNDSRFKNEVQQTLARLYYEVGEYESSDRVYREIETPILKQTHHLLERAWVDYRMGSPEKAMGYLYAFRAPSFQNFFTPEYYILKSFIYKSVCHYEKALAVINEFEQHYGDALAAIHDRTDIKDNPALLRVIIHQKQINRAWEFLLLLEKESQSVALISDPQVQEYLGRIYTLQLKKTRTAFKKLIEDAYEKMADDLLKYEEESHLIAYEIGLDMVQRVQQYHYQEKDGTGDSQDQGRKVAYPFQGEFWTHELDDYHVTLIDKCQCAEEWDVFFK